MRTTGYSKTGRDYAKFDVLSPEHPKLAELPYRTRWTWFEGVCYCQRNLSDGFIPAGIAKARGWLTDADRLIASGLWEKAPKGYRVHDYLDWNDSRADVEARIAHASKAGRASAAQRTVELPVEPGVEPRVDPPLDSTFNGQSNPALLYPALPGNPPQERPVPELVTKYLGKLRSATPRAFERVTEQEILTIAAEEQINPEQAGRFLADVWEWWSHSPPSKRWKRPTRGWRTWCRREAARMAEATAKPAAPSVTSFAPVPDPAEAQRRREELWAEAQRVAAS